MEESQDNLNSNDVHGIPPTVVAVTEILINRPLGRGGIGEVLSLIHISEPTRRS